jgi:hypothetical protein
MSAAMGSPERKLDKALIGESDLPILSHYKLAKIEARKRGCARMASDTPLLGEDVETDINQFTLLGRVNCNPLDSIAEFTEPSKLDLSSAFKPMM